MKTTRYRAAVMTPPQLVGYAAIAFILFFVIKDPAGAAHIINNVGNFLASVAKGFSAFIRSVGWAALIPLAAFGALVALWQAWRFRPRRRSWTPDLVDFLTGGLASVGAFLAGRQRAYLRETWRAELVKPRDLGQSQNLSNITKVAFAASFLVVGVRCRIADGAQLWWQAADRILASRFMSCLVRVAPCLTAIVLVIRHQGIYGLVSNAGDLSIIASASSGLIYAGRKLRKVTVKRPPEPPQKIK
jgi:hypothetical protein